AGPHVDAEVQILRVAMARVAIVVGDNIVRYGLALIAVDLRPEPVLRRLTPERTTTSEAVIDRARIVFAARVPRPQIREVEAHLVEVARPDLVATVIPGVVGADVKVVASQQLSRREIVVR